MTTTVGKGKEHVNLSVSLGQRIRERRLSKGLTQIDLSKGICTPSMVSQIESDRARPSYKVLSMIADKLQVPIDQLLTNVSLNLETVSSYKMARMMMAGGEHGSAIPLLTEVLAKPNGHVADVEIQYYLGECYLFTDQLDSAEATFRTIDETVCFNHRTWHLRVLENLGLIQLKRKRYQLAVHYWQKALDENEQSGHVDPALKGRLLLNLGVAHSKIGMVQDAIRFYEECLPFYQQTDNLQDVGKLYMELAQSYRKAQDLDKSIEYSEKACTVFELVENKCIKGRLETNCAMAYAQAGRTDEAIKRMESVFRVFQELDRREDMGTTAVEMAKIYLLMADMEKATEYSQIARALLPELHPFQSWVHLVQGRIAIENEQFQDAVPSFRKAVECFKIAEEFGEWESAMRELADVYKKLNQPDRALAIVEEITTSTRKVLEERGIML